MAKLRFSFHEPDIDTNRPIVEGQVKLDGFDLEILPYQTTEPYEAWDCGASNLPGTVASGTPDVSIPVYPNRKFRLSVIFVNEAARIEHPRDLEGKRVALAAWSNPAGMWAKGALQNSYGVDLTKIQWIVPDAKDFPFPEGFNIRRSGARKDYDQALVSGEIDAYIDPNVIPSIRNKDPRVRRLFRDYKTEEHKYFKETGIFPISHVVTLKREFVDRYPEAPVNLLQAWRKARDIAFDRVLGSDPEYLVITWAANAVEEQKALMGDNYWPYNIVDNRKTLEAMTLFAYQQGYTPHQVDYTKLFDPAAANLPGA
jgi:4,5-dihydroxyphthalate decarboxylase